jgi:DNA-binding CsgD family transcriptional regulator
MKPGTETSDIALIADPECPVLTVGNGISYSLRSFLINERAKENGESHILILIEKVVERRKIDIEKARREFQLTKREGELVSLICEGLKNREISETLFISEYTVKMHIKNIMGKMKANSRNEIIVLLK